MNDVKITSGARRAVIALLALVLLVGGGNLLATYLQVGTVKRNTATITQIHAAQVAACQLTNENLALQVTLWEHLVAVAIPPPAETAAARRARLRVTAEFISYVRRVFTPRDCAALFRI